MGTIFESNNSDSNFAKKWKSLSGPNLVSRAGDLGWTKSQVKVTNYESLIQDTTKGVDRLWQ